MTQQQQTPLTYEGILELFRQTDRKFQETMQETVRERKEFAREWRERSAELDRQMQETARQIKEANRIAKEAHNKISDLGSRIGEIIENMVAGNIVEKFQVLGYEILQCARNVKYEYKKLRIRGEIDLFLENGDLAILIEVKTTLETADVRKHIRQLEEYRQCADARGDKRRYIGAVAGAVVEGEAEDFAHANGMYVIVQSGEAVEIVPTPEGFQARKW